MRLQKSMLRPTLILAAALAAPGKLSGGTVSMTDLIALQALSADMIAGATILSYGFDPAAVFTYASTFDQTGSTGTLGGTYDGEPFGGNLDTSIGGDLTYKISGELTNGPNKGAAISFDFVQSTSNPRNFSLSKDSKIGGQAYKGTVGSATKDNTLVLRGNVQYNLQGARFADAQVRIVLNTKTNEFTSSLDFYTPKTRNIKDSGKYASVALGPNFNGAMSELITVSVPEPSALVLGVTALALGLGCRFRRAFRSIVCRLAAALCDFDVSPNG